MSLSIASWNVNSLRVRIDHVIRWLSECQPDILALQEIKLENHQFPEADFKSAGYNSLWSGQKTYNGVALLSRHPAKTKAIDRALPALDADPQQRLLAATYGDVRVINVYVPNGENLDSDKFPYKLDWLAALQAYVKAELAKFSKLVILGDFNIAPTDDDVYSPPAWTDKVLASPAERQMFNDLLDLGLKDTFRLFKQPKHTFSWWDYRGGNFKSNRGLRIDHILASCALSECCQESTVDKTPRGWEQPSDHAPVLSVFQY